MKLSHRTYFLLFTITSSVIAFCISPLAAIWHMLTAIFIFVYEIVNILREKP